MTTGFDRKAVARELGAVAELVASAGKEAGGQKYKGYVIEKSGMNFYVTDPSGHRAFGEVPASVETAKKWIDQDIREKGRKAAGRNVTAMTFILDYMSHAQVQKVESEFKKWVQWMR